MWTFWFQNKASKTVRPFYGPNSTRVKTYYIIQIQKSLRKGLLFSSALFQQCSLSVKPNNVSALQKQYNEVIQGRIFIVLAFIILLSSSLHSSPINRSEHCFLFLFSDQILSDDFSLVCLDTIGQPYTQCSCFIHRCNNSGFSRPDPVPLLVLPPKKDL